MLKNFYMLSIDNRTIKDFAKDMINRTDLKCQLWAKQPIYKGAFE